MSSSSLTSTGRRRVLLATASAALLGAPVVSRAATDLSKVTFVDSSGLRIILLAHEGARERGQEFAVTPGSPQVQRLLSITSVSEHLHVIASPDDALV